MLLTLKLVVFAILNGLASYLYDRLKARAAEKNKAKGGKKAKIRARPHKFLSRLGLWIAGALIILGSNELVDWLGRRLERPAIDIQTSDSGHLVKFKIRISKGTVDSVALNYPVVGVIGPLSDENDVTVAWTAVARAVGGATENALQNNFQLFITDIESGQNFRVFAFLYTL
jgi:hypothetical protein